MNVNAVDKSNIMVEIIFQQLYGDFEQIVIKYSH